MTDRPILFSAPMVRALLDGTKTQTRRVAKFVQTDGDCWHIRNAGGGMVGADDDAVGIYGPDYAPFAPGDRLWVKETHAHVGTSDPGWLIFRATYDECLARYGFDAPPAESEVTWKPSIFMRRCLSRLTLLVTDVRVQRLQDISEADAMAEGVERIHPNRDGDGPNHFSVHIEGGSLNAPTAVEAYRTLWNFIHQHDDAWDENPWVVAVSFIVEHRNIDA